MAYNANTDYKALIDALKKQQAATTSASEKSALQSQIDAAEQSRLEKISSNLNAYGKYATDSELDSAAGILAQNQIGTGYETAKENLNKSYDNAKINASNDALSRGMARSSYVSDRLANLDKERANALSDIDAAKVKAIQSAKAQILNDYRTNMADALADEKKEFADNIMAYYNDYQAEINRVRDNGDTTDDWKIPYLQAARNQKILAQQSAEQKLAQQSARGYSYRGNSRSTGNSSTLTFSQMRTALGQMQENGATPQQMTEFITRNGGKYSQALLDMYGLTGYSSQPQTVTPPQTQRTADYGNRTVAEVNTMINSGYTPQQVIAAAKSDLANGIITQQKYNSIVDAALRQR